ncbi:YkyA family protein [Neobacillus mesonae]|uniref:YkyA family protein n=1 Tax=Neobacillus mesonae TaxID=1193713 RepID=UPI00203C4425|nr:YkyA family protein [Neobacillus mesonae]MCM3568743.1 YkyA family protein [Neobacillus mesonae]
MKRKGYFFTIIAAMCVIFSGCSQKNNAVEDIYQVLEKTVAKEKVFEEQQEPLVRLEKKEKEMYDQIIHLGMKQYDQIVKLSDQALSSVEKRKDLMEKETESIKESESEFRKIGELKEKLEDPDLKKITEELSDIMMKRYRAHEELYKEYSVALENDKKLYEMFKNKNLPLSALEEQVKKINVMYKRISTANENFNQLTEQYNAKKAAFYKKADLTTKK